MKLLKESKLTHRHTIRVCYFANFFQAIGCVFPLLLIPLKTTTNLTYSQFGILVTLNFMTQVISDVAFSEPVDRYGFRRFAILAPIVSSSGLFLFALAPNLFPQNTFAGFVLGTILFAAAGGLQELLLSPIVDAAPIPDAERGKSMSLLHSFYAWGQICVILVTTGLLAVWGKEHWQWIVMAWALVPLISSVLFSLVPLKRRVTKEQGMMKIRELIKEKAFWVFVAAIILGGASEVTMGQWASAFLERVLLLPKAIGDLAGMCLFAFTLALGRTAYGLFGHMVCIHKVMMAGSFGAALLYLLTGITKSPVMALLACGLTGICVSLLWPGSIIIAGRRFPLAGASLFALLSAAGDIGASSGSFLVGRIADSVTPEETGLRTGLCIAALFPLVCSYVNFVILKQKSGS